MDIDRAVALTLRASALMDCPDLLFQQIIGDFIRHREKIAALITVLVAEDQLAFPDTTKQNPRVAVSASGHRASPLGSAWFLFQTRSNSTGHEGSSDDNALY
jgi:hypothetical protein